MKGRSSRAAFFVIVYTFMLELPKLILSLEIF